MTGDVSRETSFPGNAPPAAQPPAAQPRDGADWTPWEDAQLRGRAAGGLTFPELAARLHRSVAACRKRAFKIGATRPNDTTRRKTRLVATAPAA